MSAVLMVSVALGVPLVAIGLYDLQVRLEQWDHDRHAED